MSHRKVEQKKFTTHDSHFLLIGLGVVIIAVVIALQTTTSSAVTPVDSIINNRNASLAGARISVENKNNSTIVNQVSVHGVAREIFHYTSLKGSNPSASISANGKKIAYVDNLYNIRVYDTVSKSTKLIKTSVAFNNNNIKLTRSYLTASISPNGEYIISNAALYEGGVSVLLSSDGKTSTDLSCNGGDVAWADDSARFAIASSESPIGGDTSCLYVAAPNSPLSGKNILPKDSKGLTKNAFSPSWSPDGKKIAFAYEYLDSHTLADYDTANKSRGIYVVNRDGSAVTEVTTNQSYSTNPIWKDATTLMYGLSNIYTGKAKGVYSINTDGTNNTLLYSGDFSNYVPVALYPNKKTIQFMANNQAATYISGSSYVAKIYTLNIDTKVATLVSTATYTNF